MSTNLTKVVVALLALMALAGVPSQTAAASPTPNHGWDASCGSQNSPGYGWYNVKAYNVSCHVSRRRVAAHYKSSNGDHHFNGWTCNDRQTGYEVSEINCTRRLRGNHQHVRFDFGA
jgi:hypothetical protein